MPNQPIRDFKDLICWQQAIQLALACDKVADALAMMKANQHFGKIVLTM